MSAGGTTHDVVLVGGGLQNGLIALALAARHPALRVALVERGHALGGNHTWCFHADDVSPAMAEIVAPMVDQRWDGYQVHFPERARTLASPYAAVTSASLARAVGAACAARPGFAIHLGATATAVEPSRVRLADGRTLTAPLVIDARGPTGYPAAAPCGFQKFVGLELRLGQPHGWQRPVLMDARVPQTDGFRFFYVLPFAPDRVLIEDTYFSDSPSLDRDAIAAAVLAYAAAAGLVVTQVIREEAGVLPLPLDPPPGPALTADGDGRLLAAGYQGGWFHPVTGYSFPIAARLADHLSGTDDATRFGPAWQALTDAHDTQVRFALRLNRMLFRWFAPDRRYHVLDRFYRLPAETIRRFYALTTTRGDRARILFGRPPRGLSWRAVLTGRSAA